MWNYREVCRKLEEMTGDTNQELLAAELEQELQKLLAEKTQLYYKLSFAQKTIDQRKDNSPGTIKRRRVR
jgi:hypothetical protein